MSQANTARAFAPATVGNVICGFDVFGLALEAPGDEVEARRRPQPGVAITSIHGDGGRLPTDAGRNVVGVAARAVLEEAGLEDVGVELEVWKGLPLSGGMGGSAASAVAAAVATDALLGTGLSKPALLRCALEGERKAAGAAHPDNAAPALHGGIVLVRPGAPDEAVALPVPAGLTVALVHPKLELETGAMRQALSADIPLDTAVAQWADCAAFVVALYEEDWDLFARALVDRAAEPTRSPHVPGFSAVRKAALDAGALGAGLSGSGPSMFALCRSKADAEAAAEGMVEAFGAAGLEGSDRHVTPVGVEGARIVAGPDPTEPGPTEPTEREPAAPEPTDPDDPPRAAGDRP